MINLFIKGRAPQTIKLVIIWTIFAFTLNIAFNLEEPLLPENVNNNYENFSSETIDIDFLGTTADYKHLKKVNIKFSDVYMNLENFENNPFNGTGIFGFLTGLNPDEVGISIIYLPELDNLLNYLQIPNWHPNDSIFVFDEKARIDPKKGMTPDQGDYLQPTNIMNISRAELSKYSSMLSEAIIQTSTKYQLIVGEVFLESHKIDAMFIQGYLSFSEEIYNEILWSKKGEELLNKISDSITQTFLDKGVEIDSFEGHIYGIIETTQTERLFLLNLISFFKNTIIILSFLMFYNYSRKTFDENKRIDHHYILLTKKISIFIIIEGLLLGFVTSFLSYFLSNEVSRRIFNHTNLDVEFEFDYRYFLTFFIAIISLYTNYISKLTKNNFSSFSRKFKVLEFLSILVLFAILVDMGVFSSILFYFLIGIVLATITITQIMISLFGNGVSKKFLGKNQTQLWKLMMNAFSNVRTSKIFVSMLIISLIFMAYTSGSKITEYELMDNTWNLGGEIEVTTNYGNITNAEDFLNSIDEVEKIISTINLKDEYFGTKDMILENKFTILGLNINNAKEYFTEGKMKDWLTYDNNELKNDTIFVSQELETLGNNYNEDFKILINSSSGFIENQFKITNIVKSWPMITGQEDTFYASFLIMDINSLYNLLIESKTEFNVKILMRVAIEDISKLISKLQNNSIFSEIKSIDSTQFNKYTQYINIGIISCLVAFSLLWVPVILKYKDDFRYETRILAFMSLHEEVSEEHRKYRILEGLIFIMYGYFTLIFVQIMVFITEKAFISAYYSLENIETTNASVIWLLPLFSTIISITEYYKLREIDPVTILRHRE